MGDFTGNLKRRAVFIKKVPVFTSILLFMAAKSKCIFFKSRSDFEAKAVAVSSKETGTFCVSVMNDFYIKQNFAVTSK
jgi:ABC-type amino acid transport substrate-binding protein